MSIKPRIVKVFAALRSSLTSWQGVLSLLITFLIMSGSGILILGTIIDNGWLKGIGTAMLVFYFAPNGIMLFNILVVAPLWNRYVFRYEK